MDPTSEAAGVSRRDFLRFSFGNAEKTEPEPRRQVLVNQELERMGFLDTKAHVDFFPGDHLLHPAHLDLFQNADAVTGEIDRETMCVYRHIIENPGQYTITIPEDGDENKKKNALWSLMNPGIERPTKERIQQMLDVYLKLEERGVRIYSGDISSSATAHLSSVDTLERANTLNVGLAGISSLLQVGLVADATATLLKNEPMTRRKFLRLGGSLGLAGALHKVLRLQMDFDFDDAMSLGRQKALEHAIDVETTIEEVMRDLGLTDAQFEAYTKMLVDHRNNLMALHTWRTLAEEAQVKDSPRVATFYGSGHGRTEDIFDKGPEYCEGQVYKSATTYLTEGLAYLIDSELSDAAIIVALKNGMKMYPPCVRHGDAEARDSLAEYAYPRTAEMIFGDSLLEQLDAAVSEGDQRRVQILTEVMKEYIHQTNKRIHDEKKLARHSNAFLGHVDEEQIVYRRDMKPEHGGDEVIDQTYIEFDTSYNVTEDGFLEIGLYRDGINTYPLVLNALGGGDKGDLVLSEEVLATDGYLRGEKHECERVTVDDLPDGVNDILYVDNIGTGKRVARDILRIKPDERNLLMNYDVYRLNGSIAGLENPYILRRKERAT